MRKAYMSVLFISGVLLIAIIVGTISREFAGPDNALEEVAEDYIEDNLEDAAGLPDGSLQGKIDLSPSTLENK